ncbi:hypothetical protein B0H14DRAFT_2567054 [Mycena olivaceomarginata]|nr:hypothetical protein B0H14DRAFT_2567054 [Mycena olivaceomarginata]
MYRKHSRLPAPDRNYIGLDCLGAWKPWIVKVLQTTPTPCRSLWSQSDRPKMNETPHKTDGINLRTAHQPFSASTPFAELLHPVLIHIVETINEMQLFQLLSLKMKASIFEIFCGRSGLNAASIKRPSRSTQFSSAAVLTVLILGTGLPGVVLPGNLSRSATTCNDASRCSLKHSSATDFAPKITLAVEPVCVRDKYHNSDYPEHAGISASRRVIPRRQGHAFQFSV